LKKHLLCLVLGFAFTAACDASEPCGPGYTHVQGACIVTTAPATLDAGGSTEAGPATAAAADACSSPIDASIGVACTKNSECDCAAPYCAVMPGQSKGICTISGCSTTHDDCPSGYSCFDLSVFGVKDVAPFCAPKSS